MTASGKLTPPPNLPTRWGGTTPHFLAARRARNACTSSANSDVPDSAVGREADVDERLHQVRLRRRDPDVACQRVARSNAYRRAVHRGDGGLGHRAQAREHRHVLVAQHVADVLGSPHRTSADHLGDVGTGAERSAAAREHDDSNSVIALGLLDRLTQLLARERADGVHLLRPVEPDETDAVMRMDHYVLLDFSRHRPYRPLNTPLRFSRKARMPSFWSSVENRK